MSASLIGLVIVGLIPLASPASAAKWSRGCPTAARRLYPAAVGATTAPFAHPGHEIGIVLSAPEIENSGGFSTDTDGNRIEIVFASIFGSYVPLPFFTAAAVSVSTLYFDFPDAEALIGRPLAGPVEVRVFRGDQLVAHIDPSSRFVALPRANDVEAIITRQVSSSQTRTALGALDQRGYVWVPIQFRGFGTTSGTMPHCPAEFIPLSAFAVGVDVRGNGRDVSAFPPLRDVRSANLYLGDFEVDDGNAYGTRLPRPLRLLRVPGGFGVSLCAINDAADVVLRLRGRQQWTARTSGFDRWVNDSAPLPIAIGDMTADVGVTPLLQRVQFDTFGTQCRLH
jgi:hypothetical protein